MAEKKRRLERKYDHAAGTLTFTDLTKEPNESYTVNYDDVCPGLMAALKANVENWEIAVRVVGLGFNSKAGDGAASPEVDALERIGNIVSNLTGTNENPGNWNARGEGEPRDTILALAVMRVTGQEKAFVDAKLKEMTKEERADLPKKYKDISIAIKEIKSEKAAEALKAEKKAAKGKEGEAFTL